MTSAPRSGGLPPVETAEGLVFATGSEGIWPTLTERLPLPVSRPGTYSSSTAWKFVPPKPNALTPATRVSPLRTSQSRSDVFTLNGVDGQSTFGFGAAKPRLGGSVLLWMASVAFSIPAAPAAAFRWPMLDLTEPSATEPGASPAPAKDSPRLLSST